MRPQRGFLILALLALAWGFAEAVWFFLVADIVITFAASRLGIARGRVVAVSALGGALWGGIVVSLWAAIDAPGLERMLESVPAVSGAQLAAVKAEMRQGWVWALLKSGFTGNPYKLYAAAAGELGISVPFFALVSIVARGLRFLLAVLVGYVLAEGLRRSGREALIIPLWAIGWIGFYAWYWTYMPW
jgi:membrane protein YqaA with SNARE-associated domain